MVAGGGGRRWDRLGWMGAVAKGEEEEEVKKEMRRKEKKNGKKKKREGKRDRDG